MVGENWHEKLSDRCPGGMMYVGGVMAGNKWAPVRES
jgi:hypothetical protein